MALPSILALSGSTRHSSVNKVILDWIKETYAASLAVTIYDKLEELPFFNPDRTEGEQVPGEVRDFLLQLEKADGVIICTPEYVFSLPGIIKNTIEWTVATTIFQDKPTAMIVAASMGQKAFESLDLILTTVGAKMTPETKLLLTGAYGKLNRATQTLDESAVKLVKTMMISFTEMVGSR